MKRKDIEILTRGIENIFTKEELKEKIERKKVLTVKYGADPSKPDLHLGHYVCLRKLREFQELGHRVVFIIGDFTAMIGDPSERSKTRPMLTKEEVEKNSKTYFEQAYKILDKDKTEIRFNSEWLSKLKPEDIVKLSATTTVAKMLDRDDFSKRFKEGIPISLHEFLYPIFQAYDSIFIRADVEIGGTDQHFNFALTREIMRQLGLEPQVFITLPLIEGIDGKLKMSKSYGNSINFFDDPKDVFGKVMSIPDSLIFKYYKVVLLKDSEEVKEYIEKSPLEAKEDLAFEITKIFHGEKEAIKAREYFIKTFRKREVPQEVPEFKVKSKKLFEILFEAKIVQSKSEARRLIRQSGVDLDGKAIEDENYVPEKGEHILKVGKRKFFKVIVE
ncbi:MAG: tyrosine--tRNA ligase [Candidatus Hydrothermales bacterium]